MSTYYSLDGIGINTKTVSLEASQVNNTTQVENLISFLN